MQDLYEKSYIIAVGCLLTANTGVQNLKSLSIGDGNGSIIAA